MRGTFNQSHREKRKGRSKIQKILTNNIPNLTKDLIPKIREAVKISNAEKLQLLHIKTAENQAQREKSL